MRRPLAIIAAAAALALPALPAAAAPGDAAIAAATRLELQWGRCPTAAPAARALARAERTAAPRPRARRARAALHAWRDVAVACARPVAMPVVDPEA